MRYILLNLLSYVVLVVCIACNFFVTSVELDEPIHEEFQKQKPDNKQTENPRETSASKAAKPVCFDLTKLTYKDDVGNEVPYDHKAQLEQLQKLDQEGKELYLIIGRGNAEEGHKNLESENGNRVWVYGNIDSAYLKKNDVPHLYMNFDDEENLKTIPSDLLTAITFDWSVVKSFQNMDVSLMQFYRILKPGGKIYAEYMRGQSAIIGLETLEQLRDYCKKQNKKLFKLPGGRHYCLGSWDQYVVYERIIARDTGAEFLFNNIEQQQIEAKSLELQRELFDNVFGKQTTYPVRNGGYPVPENEGRFLEYTKKL